MKNGSEKHRTGGQSVPDSYREEIPKELEGDLKKLLGDSAVQPGDTFERVLERTGVDSIAEREVDYEGLLKMLDQLRANGVIHDEMEMAEVMELLREHSERE